METTIHGIDITSSALFGMRARSILRGKTREQKRVKCIWETYHG